MHSDSLIEEDASSPEGKASLGTVGISTIGENNFIKCFIQVLVNSVFRRVSRPRD